MGASRGARAAGVQWVGPSGLGEERGCRAAGCWERRAPAGATAAAAVRPGPAVKSAPRARDPRSPAQPCECPCRFREPWAGRGAGGAVPVPPQPAPLRRSRIFCPGCGPNPHQPIPGTRAARCRSSPPPGSEGRSFAPQKRPPAALPRPTLPPSNPQQGPSGWCPGALECARPEGGPSAPGWALAQSLSGSPAAFVAGEAELGMGRGRKGLQIDLQDELIFLALPAGLSRFEAWAKVSEFGLGARLFAQTWCG